MKSGSRSNGFAPICPTKTASQHPNIVQIFDLGQIGGTFYISMEHIGGRDMSRAVPKAEKLGIPFPLEYALYVAAAVLDGLAYAHTKKDDQGRPLHIVHRDITPENVMVSWTGNVKILDFGIAKAATQTDPTRAGEIKGKLSYMSPEQAMGENLDARSDLFTLGVVLYEWLTGYKLFTGENEVAVLKSIVDSKICPPTYFREDVPEGVEDILMKALAQDRTQRYQTAREMHYDIQQWLQAADFTPSPNHLANFMRQIFADELDSERRRLGQAKRLLDKTPVPEIERVPGDLSDVPNSRAAEKDTDEGSPPLAALEAAFGLDEARAELQRRRGYRRLDVTLDAGTWARLRAAAERSEVTVEEMVADLLRSYARYL